MQTHGAHILWLLLCCSGLLVVHTVGSKYRDAELMNTFTQKQCRLYNDRTGEPLSLYQVKFVSYSDNGKSKDGKVCDPYRNTYSKFSYFRKAYGDTYCDPQFDICVKQKPGSPHKGHGRCVYSESPYSDNYDEYNDKNTLVGSAIQFYDWIGPAGGLPNPYTICTPFLKPFVLAVRVKDDDDWSLDDPVAGFEEVYSQADVNSLRDGHTQLSCLQARGTDGTANMMIEVTSLRWDEENSTVVKRSFDTVGEGLLLLSPSRICHSFPYSG